MLLYYSKEENEKAYIIPLGGSNIAGLWGYLNCFEEILQQVGE